MAGREYHALGAAADAAGFYRLDGMCRLRNIRLEAVAAGHLPKTVVWSIDYGQAVNGVDFLLGT